MFKSGDKITLKSDEDEQEFIGEHESNGKLMDESGLTRDGFTTVMDVCGERIEVNGGWDISVEELKHFKLYKETATRHNQGKPELSYILDAPVAMIGLAKVFAMGAEKYERDNWKKGLNKDEIIDSLLRHLMAYKSGELVDEESGLSHAHHVHWNALVLAEQHSFGGDE